MLRLILSIVTLLFLVACGKSTINPTTRNCINQVIGNDIQIDCTDGTSTRIVNGATCSNLNIQHKVMVVEL
jgi:major membrane immunogen (membrane-anchored lipoprotein)